MGAAVDGFPDRATTVGSGSTRGGAVKFTVEVDWVRWGLVVGVGYAPEEKALMVSLGPVMLVISRRYA